MARQRIEKFELKPVVEQIEILRDHIPFLVNGGYCTSLTTDQLPKGANGWLALPRFWYLSQWNSYQEATHTVLKKMFESCSTKLEFVGNQAYNAVEIRERHLKQTKLNQLYEAQRIVYERETIVKTKFTVPQFEIIILPIKLKIIRNFFEIPKRNRLPTNQFGLGFFELYLLLLTHPEIMQYRRELWFNSQGDEYIRDTDITGTVNIPSVGLMNKDYCRDHICSTVELTGFPQYNPPA